MFWRVSTHCFLRFTQARGLGEKYLEDAAKTSGISTCQYNVLSTLQLYVECRVWFHSYQVVHHCGWIWVVRTVVKLFNCACWVLKVIVPEKTRAHCFAKGSSHKSRSMGKMQLTNSMQCCQEQDFHIWQERRKTNCLTFLGPPLRCWDLWRQWVWTDLGMWLDPQDSVFLTNSLVKSMETTRKTKSILSWHASFKEVFCLSLKAHVSGVLQFACGNGSLFNCRNYKTNSHWNNKMKKMRGAVITYHRILTEIVVRSTCDRIELHQILKIADLALNPFLKTRWCQVHLPASQTKPTLVALVTLASHDNWIVCTGHLNGISMCAFYSDQGFSWISFMHTCVSPEALRSSAGDLDPWYTRLGGRRLRILLYTLFRT